MSEEKKSKGGVWQFIKFALSQHLQVLFRY